MFQRLICWLLWRANARPRCYQTEFYALKECLLRRYGTRVGTDYQHIVKPCWSCNGTGIFDHRDYGAVPCDRCVRGIYDEFWVELERWEWCGRIFHRPAQRFRAPPMLPCNIIEGYIRHDDINHAREAFLWLMFLYDRHTWWRAMCHSWEHSWLPLSLLNRFVFWCRVKLGRIRQMSFSIDKDGRKLSAQAYPRDDIPF